MNNDQEIDRGEFAPVKLDVLCPCCRHAFQPDSEQAICVELFGECIFCRFSPNSKGSKSGTQAELSEIVVKQEVKRRFKNQQPKVIDMQKQMQSSVDKAVNAMAQPEQEPVTFEKTVCPFCTSEWVTAEQHDRNVDRVERKPLTDEEIADLYFNKFSMGELKAFARAIEAAHNIKETEK